MNEKPKWVRATPEVYSAVKEKIKDGQWFRKGSKMITPEEKRLEIKSLPCVAGTNNDVVVKKNLYGRPTGSGLKRRAEVLRRIGELRARYPDKNVWVSVHDTTNILGFVMNDYINGRKPPNDFQILNFKRLKAGGNKNQYPLTCVLVDRNLVTFVKNRQWRENWNARNQEAFVEKQRAAAKKRAGTKYNKVPRLVPSEPVKAEENKAAVKSDYDLKKERMEDQVAARKAKRRAIIEQINKRFLEVETRVQDVAKASAKEAQEIKESLKGLVAEISYVRDTRPEAPNYGHIIRQHGEKITKYDTRLTALEKVVHKPRPVRGMNGAGLWVGIAIGFAACVMIVLTVILMTITMTSG